MVPVPARHGTVRSGTPIPEAAASSLRPGETRRADVLAVLGPPARRFDDLRIDAYGWSDVSWYFPWLFAVGGGAAPVGMAGMLERWQRHLLVVQYHPDDRVERMAFRICGSNETIGECVHQWADATGPVLRTAAQEPHADLYVWCPESNRSGAEALVDGELAAELPSGTWSVLHVRPGLRVVTVRVRAAPQGKSSLSQGADCSVLGGTSFGLRMAAGRTYDVEVGAHVLPDAVCPTARWGVRRAADGVAARAGLREVW